MPQRSRVQGTARGFGIARRQSALNPAHCAAEFVDPQIGVPRQNILQLLPDAVVPTKEQLADYWQHVSKQALPHLGHRPLKLVRHVHGMTFYHKGPLPKDIPNAVHQLHIEKREDGESVRLWVDIDTSHDGRSCKTERARFVGMTADRVVGMNPPPGLSALFMVGAQGLEPWTR